MKQTRNINKLAKKKAEETVITFFAQKGLPLPQKNEIVYELAEFIWRKHFEHIQIIDEMIKARLRQSRKK